MTQKQRANNYFGISSIAFFIGNIGNHFANTKKQLKHDQNIENNVSNTTHTKNVHRRKIPLEHQKPEHQNSPSNHENH